MSLHTGRNAVFLEEMGLAPLWRLRAAAPAAPAASALDVPTTVIAAELAPAVAAPAPVAVDPAPVPVPMALAAVPVPVPLPASAEPAPLPLVESPAPTPPVQVPAPVPADDSTAWFDDAPAAPPAPPVTEAEIAAMNWDELKTAISKCTRCALARGRKNAVPGRGDGQAEWLFLGGAPGRGDEKEGRAVSGEAGKLLDNMLLAIGLASDKNVYVSNLVKCRASDASGLDRAPSAPELAACRPYLERELALTGGRRIVTFGQAAVRGLLLSPTAARGVVHRLGTIPVVATYHPQDLLLQRENKARAWADLCLARSADAGPA